MIGVTRRAVRLLACALAIVFVFSAFGAMNRATGETVVAESTGESIVKVGWTGSIVNWNPLNVEMAEDYVASNLIFSSLFTYDEDWGGPVEDLAWGYDMTVNADWTMTTVIWISQNAYFRNAANPTDTSRQLTADDVEYTYELIMANPGYAWGYRFVGVQSVDVINDFAVEIVTEYPMATLIDSLADVPIVPEFYWSTLSKPFGAMYPKNLIGSGPFMFDSYLRGVWCKFLTAPNYHGTEDYGDARDVKVGGIMYTTYADITALSPAINYGTEDTVVVTGNPDIFLNVIGDGASVNVIKQAVSEPGICDIAINAIPLELRTATYGQGNPVLLDPAVRQAILMTLDKEYIVDTLMRGLAETADSVIQPGFWHKIIENQLPYDPLAARQLLMDNGYDDSDGDGFLEAGPDAYSVVMGYVPVGFELSGIRCQAPDSDPTYGMIAMVWAGWAAEAGIGLVPSIESEIVMINEAWYKADYDIWVWHWGWGPEPLTGALSTWLSSEITAGGDNCQMPMGDWYTIDDVTGEVYSSYDENYSTALWTLDTADRKVIVGNLQQMICDSYTECPPYYDVGLYAYTDERYTGWGDWSSHPGRTTASGLFWLWFDLDEQTEGLPVFATSILPYYQTVVGEPITFVVSVYDNEGDDISVNWSFGDGVCDFDYLTGDTTVPTTLTRTHAYSSAGTMTLWVSAHDFIWGHQVNTYAQVDVLLPTENPPFAYIGIFPGIGDTNTLFTLDPSYSWDYEDPYDALTGRWDFENDGVWDTGFNPLSPQYVSYETVGYHWITLEVMDTSGLTAQCTDGLLVDDYPPEANAGSDVTVTEGTTVTLDGTGSVDDVQLSKWMWTFVYGGGMVVLYGPMVPFTFDVPGEYVVTLEVTDSALKTDTDTATVTVLEPGIMVVALSGPSGSDSISWQFVTGMDGAWIGRIANYGLKSLDIKVYKLSADAPPELVYKAKVMFRAADAYPTGTAWTVPIEMDAGDTLLITVDPQGAEGTYAYVYDEFVQYDH